MPAESTLQGGTIDTQFKGGFAGDASLQVFLFRHYSDLFLL